MLPYHLALERILSIPYGPETEYVSLLDSNGRVLAKAPKAPFAMPRYDQSAMDGFALRSKDTRSALIARGVPFTVRGESAAGHPYEGKAIAEGEAVKISTGARLPDGCDAVVPVERVEVSGKTITVRDEMSNGQFVRYEGEDVAEGVPLLAPGRRLDGPAIAFLASFNITQVEVYQRPRIAILTSGDEIKPLGAKLLEHQIVGSSLYFLENELRHCGCEVKNFGIAPDDSTRLRQLILDARAWGDIIVSTAGVSVGEHDLTGNILGDLSAKVLFWQVAVRPGKPMLVATLSGKPYFGLPGNPVSTCCNVEVFLKPFLRQAFQMLPAVLPLERVILAGECPRDDKRLFFVYAQTRIQNGQRLAIPLPRQSSANLTNPAKADVLLVIEPGRDPIASGTAVQMLPIRDGL